MRAPERRPLWRRLLVPALVLLGLNAAVFLVYTLPHTMQERSLASRVVALRGELERERQHSAEIKRQVEIVEANTREAERFCDDVLAGRQEAMLNTLKELERTAQEAGLKPERRAYKREDVKQAPLVRLDITMPVSGSYSQLVSFLERLEHSPRFLVVQHVQLREREGAGDADLSFDLSAYFRADPVANHGG